VRRLSLRLLELSEKSSDEIGAEELLSSFSFLLFFFFLLLPLFSYSRFLHASPALALLTSMALSVDRCSSNNGGFDVLGRSRLLLSLLLERLLLLSLRLEASLLGFALELDKGFLGLDGGEEGVREGRWRFVVGVG
jgi:hypothetical protein